jgi:hypothetical protein
VQNQLLSSRALVLSRHDTISTGFDCLRDMLGEPSIETGFCLERFSTALNIWRLTKYRGSANPGEIYSA